jgi:hypothetical protein
MATRSPSPQTTSRHDAHGAIPWCDRGPWQCGGAPCDRYPQPHAICRLRGTHSHADDNNNGMSIGIAPTGRFAVCFIVHTYPPRRNRQVFLRAQRTRTEEAAPLRDVRDPRARCVMQHWGSGCCDANGPEGARSFQC